ERVGDMQAGRRQSCAALSRAAAGPWAVVPFAVSSNKVGLLFMPAPQVGIRAHPGAVLAAATILGLPLGSLYAFSVLLAPLEKLLEASRSELASVFGISAVFFTIGANLVPRLFGRLG